MTFDEDETERLKNIISGFDATSHNLFMEKERLMKISKKEIIDEYIESKRN